MCKWPWHGLWLSHHIATYLCSNFTSSTDLLEVNPPTTWNVTKWDAIHSNLQYLLEFGNNLETGEGVQSMAPFLTDRFTEDFEFVDIKHKVRNLVQRFLAPDQKCFTKSYIWIYGFELNEFWFCSYDSSGCFNVSWITKFCSKWLSSQVSWLHQILCSPI